MTAEDIRSADLLSMLMMYEAEIADWYEKFERGEITKGNYSKIRDELVNKQFVLINKFKSDIINEFVEHTGDGDCAWWIEAKAREYLEPE